MRFLRVALLVWVVRAYPRLTAALVAGAGLFLLWAMLHYPAPLHAGLGMAR